MKTNWLPCFTLGYGAVTGAAVKASCHAINKRWIFLGFPSPTGIAQIAILIFVFLFKKFLYLLYFYNNLFAFFCVILRLNYSKRLICSDSVQNLFGLWLTQLTNQPVPVGHLIKLFPNTLSVAAVFTSSYFCLKISKLLGKKLHKQLAIHDRMISVQRSSSSAGINVEVTVLFPSTWTVNPFMSSRLFYNITLTNLYFIKLTSIYADQPTKPQANLYP